MKTRISTLLATLAVGLAFSAASHAAWFAKLDGVDGSSKSTAGFNKKVDGFSVEHPVIEAHSQKPKEIVVVESKTPGPRQIEGNGTVKKVGALKTAKMLVLKEPWPAKTDTTPLAPPTRPRR